MSQVRPFLRLYGMRPLRPNSALAKTYDLSVLLSAVVSGLGLTSFPIRFAFRRLHQIESLCNALPHGHFLWWLNSIKGILNRKSLRYQRIETRRGQSHVLDFSVTVALSQIRHLIKEIADFMGSHHGKCLSNRHFPHLLRCFFQECVRHKLGAREFAFQSRNPQLQLLWIFPSKALLKPRKQFSVQASAICFCSLLDSLLQTIRHAERIRGGLVSICSHS